MGQTEFSDSKKAALEKLIEDEKFNTRFWARIKRWGHWVFAFVVGLPVLADAIERIVNLIKKHG